MKTLLLAAGIISGLFALFIFTTPITKESVINNTPSTNNPQSGNIEESADINNKPILYIGNPNAPATLVEYGDFKCPSCNSFHRQTGAQLRQEYVQDGRLKIEYRNYPFLGPDSGRVARGTYCSYDQGVFQEYHDRVYDYIWDEHYESGDYSAEFENVLTAEKLINIMGDTINDLETFKNCLESVEKNKFIDADLLLSSNDKITGTPGFTIAGQTITGPQGYTTFKTLIDIELQ